MKAKDFDKKFDKGEDISEYLDITRARRPEQVQKKASSRPEKYTVTDPHAFAPIRISAQARTK